MYILHSNKVFKHISLTRRVLEDGQGLQPGSSASGSSYNNYYMGTSIGGIYTEGAEANLDLAQDISPKDITVIVCPCHHFISAKL